MGGDGPQAGGEDAACGEVRPLLTDYVAGRLSSQDRSRVEAHLGECGFCRREANRLRARGPHTVAIVILVAAVMGAAVGGAEVAKRWREVQDHLSRWRQAERPAPAPPQEDLRREGAVRGPTVVRDEGTGRLTMWYNIRLPSVTPGRGTDRRYAVGMAQSDDGTHWTRHAQNPVFTDNAAWPTVLRDVDSLPDQRFRMWYNVYPGTGIRHAWSADGIIWQGREPALAKGPKGAFDDLNVAAPCVVRGRDGRYLMYYDAGSSAEQRLPGWPHNHYIALAVSPLGQRWTKHGIVLTRGAQDEWDGWRIYNACVLYDPREDLYEMWYAARPAASSGLVGGVGYAVSLDGLKWMKSPRNPGLPSSPRSPGRDASMGPPAVLKDERGYRVWFIAAGAIRHADLPLDAYRAEHEAVRSGR